MSQAENGMYETWSNPMAMDTNLKKSSTLYFDKYWKKYFKVQKICTSYSDCGYDRFQPWKFALSNNYSLASSVGSQGISFLTADGAFICIRIQSGSSASSVILVDLNGAKDPNRNGKDYFVFNRSKKGILPHCMGLPDICSKNASPISDSCCAAKIMEDGWEIKEDYPW